MVESSIDTYRVLVDVLTITLAIIAVAIGGGIFGMYQSLRHKLEREIRDEARKEIQIEKARFFISHGHMFWIDFKVSDSPPAVKVDYLKQAIIETEKGLNLIKHSKEDTAEEYYEKELILCWGMNNLAYYYYKMPKADTPKGADELSERYAKYVYSKITIFPQYKTNWTDTYRKVILKEQD